MLLESEFFCNTVEMELKTHSAFCMLYLVAKGHVLV